MDQTGVKTQISVLCVDDNPHVADALRVQFESKDEFQWCGWVADADGLLEAVRERTPHVVLLDIDMPGRDPLHAAAELLDECPASRVVVFSGHVRRELIARALEAGAWGYVSKNDGCETLLDVIRRVAAGEFAFSPEAKAIYL